MYPRSTPIGYAVSAKPTAAMLEKLFDGQRSGVRPLFGSLRSQNQLKVRRSNVSRKAACLVDSREGGNDPGAPLMPVIDVADVHAEEVIAATIIQLRHRESARIISVLNALILLQDVHRGKKKPALTASPQPAPALSCVNSSRRFRS